MGAPQRKVRAVVVERGTTPAGSLVTARAVAAELAVMSILVATIALAHGLVEWLVVHVAAFTGDGSMCPGQGKSVRSWGKSARSRPMMSPSRPDGRCDS